MEDEGDAHTLDLLTDLRNLCDEINAAHGGFTARLNDLMRQVANPNVHSLDRELTFRVMQLEVTEEQYPDAPRDLAQRQWPGRASSVSCGREGLPNSPLGPSVGNDGDGAVRPAQGVA